MRRARWTGWMLTVTLAAVAGMLMLQNGSEKAVPARIATVTLGTVENVAALSGRVAFLEETMAYAAVPGIVEEVYVTSGQRVAEGQALLRLDASGAERAVSAWISAGKQVQGALSAEDAQQLLDSTVVRAPENATVRQVLAKEHAAVAAGAPVALLSSTAQVIVCTVQEADAREVRPGMKAALAIDGETLCSAEVTEISDLTADALTGRMVCQITLEPEKRLELPAGTAVDADVHLSGRENVPVLPVEAITERGTIWWVCDGRCTEIPAEIVLSDEMQAWVLLPEGLRVAVGEFTEGQQVTEVLP